MHYTTLLRSLVLLSLMGLAACSGSKNVAPPRKEKSESIKNAPQVATVISEARKYLGTRYKYAGNDKKGIDCSGLTCQAYKAVGIKLPRVAGDQVSAGKSVSAQQLQPGDLVFFKASTKSSGKITHVGIVTEVSKDNARFIHASTSKGVIENELLSGYWKPLLVKAVRVL